MKERVRISITLRPEIVNLLDNNIDGTKIRNRSHAVEHFLRESLATPVGQAVILIEDENKSLTTVCGETVIDKMLYQLDKASINKIIVCCTKKCKKIQKHLKKKKYNKFQFTFTENPLKGTAAALMNCKQHLSPETFLLIYGDVIAELDVYDLGDFHKASNGIATMVVTSISDPLPWGVVRVKRDRILEFHEKPTSKPSAKKRLTNIINAGIYAFQPEIFSYMNKRSKSLEKEVIPKLINQKALYSYLLDGAWFNISHEHLLKHAKTYCRPKK